MCTTGHAGLRLELLPNYETEEGLSRQMSNICFYLGIGIPSALVCKPYRAHGKHSPTQIIKLLYLNNLKIG